MLDNQLLEDLTFKRLTDITPGLKVITQVLDLLNNPQNNYKVVHIAGTNGKGSVANFIEAGLVLAGYKVGKFTSPHIYQLNECISVNHSLITDDEFNYTYIKVKNILDDNQLKLSPFEFLTVIMFEYFKERQIEWLVLECGMGGLFDATNVVDSKYSIITNIGLEHTIFLGDTLEQIALHKLGIIKNGLVVIGSYDQHLIANISHDNYICVERDFDYVATIDKNSLETLVTIDGQEFRLKMLGMFQVINFLCAYVVLKHIGVVDSILHKVARETVWQYRLQVISYNPIVIVDATHNELGAKAIYQTLSQIYSPKEIVIVASILKDKAINKMLEIFSQIGESIVLTSINHERGCQAYELEHIARDKFKHIYIENKPNDALVFARKLGKRVILVTGSLYLLSEINLKQTSPNK